MQKKHGRKDYPPFITKRLEVIEVLHDEVTTGSATVKDWRAATKDMKIGAYWPGETTITSEPPERREGRDKRAGTNAPHGSGSPRSAQDATE